MKNFLTKGKDYIGVGVGAIIFNDEGKVFLNKRGQKARNERGKWEFPGGGVEFNEKCEDAIKREIKEEFDFEVEILELLVLEDHLIPDEGQHWIAPTYIAKVAAGTPKVMEPDRSDGIKWVDLKDIQKEDLSIITSQDIKFYLEKYGPSPYKKAL